MLCCREMAAVIAQLQAGARKAEAEAARQEAGDAAPAGDDAEEEQQERADADEEADAEAEDAEEAAAAVSGALQSCKTGLSADDIALFRTCTRLQCAGQEYEGSCRRGPRAASLLCVEQIEQSAE